MDKPIIRLARIEDAAEIFTLICEHADYEKEAYPQEGKLEKLKSSLVAEPPFYTCLVVENDEGLQGYCIYMPQFDCWYGEPYLYVDALFLRESMRGASLGKTLMEMVASDARERGMKFLRLVTPTHNALGIGFYRKLGGESAEKLLFTFPLGKQETF